MKKIKVFFHGERLRDIYPHATRWQVFKWKLRKFVRKLVLVSTAVSIVYGAFIAGSSYFPKTVYQAAAEKIVTIENDSLGKKVEELKNEVIADLKNCENAQFGEDDGIIIFDSNNKASIGEFQFQKATVIHYFKRLYGKDITGKEAVLIAIDTEKASQLAKDIIFKTENGVGKDWVICSKNYGLQEKVDMIKSLLK